MLSALQDGGERSKVLLARLAEQPKSPAIIGVAELLCEQGHFGEAITRLRAMAELYDDSYRYHLVLARAYRDSGDFERAKRHYEKACQIAPQNEVAMKELIALAAFPQSLKKSAPSAPAPEAPTPTVSASQPSLPEVPSDFKLDREKLSRVLSGVVSDSSATKSPSATETTRDD
ncbi:MAG: tetratricopeptide repeat protein, partial [Chloroherpetonaceae bacterium]|nr:tetratricopeptide repeat protein [Chloroherpetonaceae bacterium]